MTFPQLHTELQIFFHYWFVNLLPCSMFFALDYVIQCIKSSLLFPNINKLCIKKSKACVQKIRKMNNSAQIIKFGIYCLRFQECNNRNYGKNIKLSIKERYFQQPCGTRSLYNRTQHISKFSITIRPLQGIFWTLKVGRHGDV